MAPRQTIRQRNLTGMSLAFTLTNKHVYEGTVPQEAKAARRRKNKAARAARRAGRR